MYASSKPCSEDVLAAGVVAKVVSNFQTLKAVRKAEGRTSLLGTHDVETMSLSEHFTWRAVQLRGFGTRSRDESNMIGLVGIEFAAS